MSILSGQPYPDVHGWQDLAPHLVNNWSRRGVTRSGYKAAGNDLKVSASLLVGDIRFIAEGLPSFTAGTQLLSAYVESSSGTAPVSIRWNTDGTLVISPVDWQWAQGYTGLVINAEVPR